MDLIDLRAQLEAEQQWRQEEIHFFQNQGANITEETKQNQFRRAIILLLYAHFEGFCKVAFTLYINAINETHITCGQANYAIAAVSLANVFNTLRNPEKKCPEFRHQLPDDTKLHKFARDREFIEQIDRFKERQVNITDTIVDPESNLKPIVLRKILYRLGLPYEQFDRFEGKINKLLRYRNDIAHGKSRIGITIEEYEDLRTAVYNIMNQIITKITDALQNEIYLRQE